MPKSLQVKKSKRRVAEIRRERSNIQTQMRVLTCRDEELFKELLREVAKQAR